MKSKDPMVQRFLGVIEGNGKSLGLDEKWAYNIIKQVGNYGEIYDKHIASTGIMPDRGPNELWTKGGILYVAPAR